MNKYYAGIDMGGTNTVIGIVGVNGKILLKTVISTYEYDTPEKYAESLSVIIDEMQKKMGVKISGIGIGAPNGNFYSGTIEFAPNLKWRGVIPLASYIE